MQRDHDHSLPAGFHRNCRKQSLRWRLHMGRWQLVEATLLLKPEGAQLGHQSWGRVGRDGRSGRATLLHSPAKQVLAEISERPIKYGGIRCHFSKVTAEAKITLSIILTVLCPLCHYYAGPFLPCWITTLCLYGLGCFKVSRNLSL